jgi:hypothetical protein
MIRAPVNELAAPFPFDLPAEREIRLASPTTVKRTKMSYGDGGILMLTSDRLLFVTKEAKKCWSLPLSEITDVERPSYGLGTYVTFKRRGEYYALAFAEDAVDASADTTQVTSPFAGTAHELSAGGGSPATEPLPPRVLGDSGGRGARDPRTGGRKRGSGGEP